MQYKSSLKHKKIYTQLWFWVILAMLLGISFGIIDPQHAKITKPIIDVFIHLIKILVGPIIFLSILSGIMNMRDLKQLGSIGIKALLYFEVVSTISLLIGLSFGHIFHPGLGLNLSVSSIDTSVISQHLAHANTKEVTSLRSILLHAIPHNPLKSFVEGNTLQIIFMALVSSFILFYIPSSKKTKAIKIIHKLQSYSFKILSWVILLSPFAAFAAMAFMLGEFGTGIILHMLSLVLTMIGACLFFVIVVLGLIAKLAGINIIRFLSFIKDEIVLVFATSSSESALGPLMRKLENNGVSSSVVGIVVPAGYSFNLDGTNIYLSLAIAFLCQAFNINLSMQEYLTIILVLMISSKGAAGVTGSGFIVLAGTLAALNKIPVETIAILVGIDKVMSDLRSMTNLVGNSLTSVIIAKWEKKLNITKLNLALFKAHNQHSKEN